MPFPTLETAALSGASVSQLNYWRTPRGRQKPLLAPEYRDTRPYRYSYRDLIALRTFVYLRGSTSLQKIRRAVQTLENLEDLEHLSEYVLRASGDSIILVQPGDDMDEEWRYTDLVKRPGQQGIPVFMSDVLGRFETKAGRIVLPLPNPIVGISVHPETLR